MPRLVAFFFRSPGDRDLCLHFPADGSSSPDSDDSFRRSSSLSSDALSEPLGEGEGVHRLDGPAPFSSPTRRFRSFTILLTLSFS